MEHQSTRGNAPHLGFIDTILAGLAEDGGLYLPTEYPTITHAEMKALQGKSYTEIAEDIISRFVGDEVPKDILRSSIDEAYATFNHKSVAPLVQIGPNEFVLELFHGPTLAFKDIAMQWLARVMDYALEQRGERATIIGATSGDTGSAAIEAFRGRGNTDIFILYPHGKVSDVQRRQMTTIADANVHTLAVDGDFDDCQALVKAMFTHKSFRNELSLSGVNSINWGRILAQIVYYFSSAISLGAPDRKVSFAVPSGNFGDILAGYIAKKMGLPIDDLIIATNKNDILVRTLETGRYQVTGTEPTTSPSMDIQVSSNFERAMFDASGKDADTIRHHMARLSQSGAFELSPPELSALRKEFSAVRASEVDVKETIATTLKESGYQSDPHTATGLYAAKKHLSSKSIMIVLATAHPAKFPEAVKAATGNWPQLPAHLADLMERPERIQTISKDLDAIEKYIRNHARAIK